MKKYKVRLFCEGIRDHIGEVKLTIEAACEEAARAFVNDMASALEENGDNFWSSAYDVEEKP